VVVSLPNRDPHVDPRFYYASLCHSCDGRSCSPGSTYIDFGSWIGPTVLFAAPYAAKVRRRLAGVAWVAYANRR
jgi:hypothetical protein